MTRDLGFILTFIWLALGLGLVTPLLVATNKVSTKASIHILGTSLIIAALIYIGFAAVWGNDEWLLIESGGVLVYAAFYWLAVKYSMLWLALGWFLHPVWDALLHLYGPGAHIVPHWYAFACISFDVAVALFLLHKYGEVRNSVS